MYEDSLFNYDLELKNQKLKVSKKDREFLEEVKYKETIRKDQYLSDENKLKVEILDYLFQEFPDFENINKLVSKLIFSKMFSGRSKSLPECRPSLFQVINLKKDLPNRFFVIGKTLTPNLVESKKEIKNFIIKQRKLFLCFGSSIYNTHFHDIIRRSNLLLFTYDSGDSETRNRLYQLFSDMIESEEKRFKVVLLDKRLSLIHI